MIDKTNWEELKLKTDEEIREGIANDPDACPELDDKFFTQARLNKLIEELQGATEGSRELDANIFYRGRDPCPEWQGGWYTADFIPHYTTSLDAALTLIPEGWFLETLNDFRTPIVYKSDKHQHVNWLVELQHITGGQLKWSHATGPALALCITALKARNNE